MAIDEPKEIQALLNWGMQKRGAFRKLVRLAEQGNEYAVIALNAIELDGQGFTRERLGRVAPPYGRK